MAKEIFDIIQDLRASGRPFAVATVVETVGSVSAKTSSKAVVDEHGRVVAGWVGGGCAESATCDQAVECMQSGRDRGARNRSGRRGAGCRHALRRPHAGLRGTGICPAHACGSWVTAGWRNACAAWVTCSDSTWWSTTPWSIATHYPAASRLVTDDPDYDALTPGRGDFVVIATQHKGDHESMKRALASEAGYIALIASRKRSRLVLDYLRQAGFAETELERVMAPSGLDLGARTPEEIALCVMSEIVLVRRGGTGMRMRDKLRAEQDPQKLASVGA